MQHNQPKQYKRKQHVPWKAALTKIRTHLLRKSHVVKVTVRNPGKRPVHRLLYVHDEQPLARVSQGMRDAY